jgi:hypothetical protein
VSCLFIQTVSSTNRHKNAENQKKLAIDGETKKTRPISAIGSLEHFREYLTILNYGIAAILALRDPDQCPV